jgi:hypothetical protein
MTDHINDDKPSLGACCMCETTDSGENIVMLDHAGLVPGHGWGCVVCGLPANGAVAVLCEPCLSRFQGGEPLRFFCRGYPSTDGRAPMADLPRATFAHDKSKHGETAEDDKADLAKKIGAEIVKPRLNQMVKEVVDDCKAKGTFDDPAISMAVMAECLTMAVFMAFHLDCTRAGRAAYIDLAASIFDDVSKYCEKIDEEPTNQTVGG